MYSWESSDQYVPDTESRYPQFSDMQTTDHSAGFYGRVSDRRGYKSYGDQSIMSPHVPQFSRTREDQYLNGALGVPSYYQCRCGACPDYLTDWPRRKPVRRPIRDNDMLSLGLGGQLGPSYNCLGCPSAQTNQLPLAQRSANAAASVGAGSGAGSSLTNLPFVGSLDNMTILLVFMFLILIFIVVVGGRALNDLRSQIKKLKKSASA